MTGGWPLRVMPGAEAWRPSVEAERRIRSCYGPLRAEVRIVPRREAKRWTEKNGEDYRFRAVCRDGVITILVDPTETRDSVAWLLAHELGHVVAVRDGIRSGLQRGRDEGMDPASDRFHEVDPEERWADGLATRCLGTRYDRAWWRRRTPMAR